MMNKNESLSKTTKSLLLTEPFWGLFLIGFRKSWSDQIPTACVSKNGITYGLTINDGFWNGLDDDTRKFVLQHEAIHIGYHHLTGQEEFEDSNLRNLSDDIVVNQDCNQDWKPCKDMTPKQFEEKFTPIMKAVYQDFKDGKITREEYNKEIHKIPARGVYLEDFPDFKLKPRESRRYYYNKLKQESEKNGGKGPNNPSGKYLKSLMDTGMSGDDGPLGHGLWKEFENLSEAEKKLIHSQLDYQLKEVAEQVIKSRGNVPGNIADYLKGLDLTEPPKFDWKSYLKRFIGGSSKVTFKYTRTKLNKRYSDNPGVQMLPKKHVLVCVDTSGSVSKEELIEFFQEIDHISKISQVTVLQCDAAISDISPYKKGCAEGFNIKGRCGTEFSPSIDYFNENFKRFTCGMYLTDGECSPPETPPRGKFLWVHSNRSTINENLPGYKIKLDL